MVPPVQVSPLIKVNQVSRPPFSARLRVGARACDPGGLGPLSALLAPRVRAPLTPRARDPLPRSLHPCDPARCGAPRTLVTPRRL